VGRGAIRFVGVGRELLNFLGLVMTVLVRVLARPWRLRSTALINHMEDTGLNALPIIGLLSFLIGVVLAYNGAVQLRPFGAEVFTINLIGIGTLREFGVLITAIIVAGRSGSAFTAAIGSMRVNQETDAIETMGLDPIEVLVVPRLLALIIVMPLLTFWANMAGLLGGTVVVMQLVGMTFAQIAEWFLNGVNSANFWLGMVKAPVFGALIALVGCHQGLMVEGSAESLGRLTTRSVVVSIFLVIVADAIFSVATTQIGL
jgi:phospholipid/cholesterol/gamma-HCH transport system permease protein